MNKKKLFIILIIPIALLLVWIFTIARLMVASVSPGPEPKEPKTTCTGDNCKTTPVPPCAGDDCKLSGDNQLLSGELTLHMPDFFYNDKSFGQFRKQLKKNTNVTLNFYKYKNLEEFHQEMIGKLSKGGTGIDLMLVPIDWIDSLQDYAFQYPLPNNYINSFHELFYDYMTADSYTFLPYGIDPFVILVSNKSNTFQGKIDMNAIKQSVLIGNADKLAKIRIKLLMGVSSQDLNLIAKGKQPFDSYFLVLYNLLYQAFLTSDNELIESLIEFGDEGAYKTRSFGKFYKIFKKLSTQNDECMNYGKICVLLNGYSDISMGFLSDLDKIDRYFNNTKLGKSDFRIYNFIKNTENYRVRGRGFLINKNSKNFEQIQAFINAYMSEDYNNVRQAMWPNILPAFNELFDQKMSETEYELLNKYDTSFEIFSTPKDFMQRFLDETKILDVLRGKYSIKAFLEDPNWEF